MALRKKLRMIALLMLVIAIGFVLCAVSCPTLGQVIYIGDFSFGPEQWRICYGIYAAVMLALFVASLFVGGKASGSSR